MSLQLNLRLVTRMLRVPLDGSQTGMQDIRKVLQAVTLPLVEPTSFLTIYSHIAGFGGPALWFDYHRSVLPISFPEYGSVFLGDKTAGCFTRNTVGQFGAHIRIISTTRYCGAAKILKARNEPDIDHHCNTPRWVESYQQSSLPGHCPNCRYPRPQP